MNSQQEKNLSNEKAILAILSYKGAPALSMLYNT